MTKTRQARANRAIPAEDLIGRVEGYDDLYGISMARTARNVPELLTVIYKAEIRYLRSRSGRLIRLADEQRSDSDILAEVTLQRRTWEALEVLIIEQVGRNPIETVETVDRTTGSVSRTRTRGRRRVAVEKIARITGMAPGTVRKIVEQAEGVGAKTPAGAQPLPFVERLQSVLDQDAGRR